MMVVKSVTDTNFYLTKSIKNTRFRQSHPVTPAGAESLPPQHRVDPAAAAWAPGDGSEFAAALTDGPSNLIVLLGWKRTRPDPGRVGFADSKHVTHRGRTKARSGRRLGCNRVG